MEEPGGSVPPTSEPPAVGKGGPLAGLELRRDRHIPVKRLELLGPHVRIVRRTEGDIGGERLLRRALPANPVQRQVHREDRTVSGHHQVLPGGLIAEFAAGVVEVGRIKRGVEAHLERMGLAPAQVPLAEVAGGVAGGLQRLGDRDLLRPDGVEERDATAAGRPARQDGEPARRTHLLARIAIVEPHPAGDQRIEVRRLGVRAALLAGVAPAHVVGEDDDDVGTARRRNCCAGPGPSRQRRQRRAPYAGLDELPAIHGFTRSFPSKLLRTPLRHASNAARIALAFSGKASVRSFFISSSA